MVKKFLQVQSAIILTGVIFAWYTVVGDFIKFFKVETNLFKFSSCLAPNPLATTCFYGAWAFLIAFVWSALILKMPEEKRKSHQKGLIVLLVAGTLFAWGNFGYELIKFLSAQNQPVAGCSGNLVVNPLATPCFIGAMLFSLSLIASLLVLKKQNKHQSWN